MKQAQISKRARHWLVRLLAELEPGKVRSRFCIQNNNLAKQLGRPIMWRKTYGDQLIVVS
jgi:hypothetical protein